MGFTAGLDSSHGMRLSVPRVSSHCAMDMYKAGQGQGMTVGLMGSHLLVDCISETLGHR